MNSLLYHRREPHHGHRMPSICQILQGRKRTTSGTQSAINMSDLTSQKENHIMDREYNQYVRSYRSERENHIMDTECHQYIRSYKAEREPHHGHRVPSTCQILQGRKRTKLWIQSAINMSDLTGHRGRTIISWTQCTLYKKLYLLEPLWKLRLPLDGSKCHLFSQFIHQRRYHMVWFSQSQQLCLKGSKIWIKLVSQITHINPCKQEIVPQENDVLQLNKPATSDVW